MVSTEESVFDFKVEGMTCGSCAARVQRTLEKVEGVERADVNFATHQVRVQVSDQTVQSLDLEAAVERTGCMAGPAKDSSKDMVREATAAIERLVKS